MLSKQERDLILAEFAKNMKDARRAKGAIIPEEDTLYDGEFPGYGLHKHDENNPFGTHRHHAGDDIDGAHVHSPQNPGGEHSHGPRAGMELIDGRHFHEHDSLGWHHHEEHDNKNPGEIPIEKLT